MRFAQQMAGRGLAVVLLGLAVAAVILAAGCRKQDDIFVDRNLAPDTRLTSAPAPYSQQNYKVHMYWDGSDADGFITGYYFAWDDTAAGAWVFTTRSDSLFKALIDTAGETRRHTFYVRSVDNEGKLDPTPARVRFDAWTVLPRVEGLYRIDGPKDPNSPNYDPSYRDTVLMGTDCSFVWSGYDPDGGPGAPVDFRWRLDSNDPSAWVPVTQATATDVPSGTHTVYVQAKDETGAECFPASYRFEMNFAPDCEILEPADPSGTLTVADRDTVWFRWNARDKEEDEGVAGGVVEVWVELDGAAFLRVFEYDGPPYTGEWYFTSRVAGTNPHYIASYNLNPPAGGNRPHELRIYAKDVEGRVENTSLLPDDREYYTFWYNNPPQTTILHPAPGETLGPNFTVSWIGSDPDGVVETYQYVLDPRVNTWSWNQATSATYTNVPPGEHIFKVHARDNSDCWEPGYKEVVFYVE
jgi:hypothetical protein